MSVVACTAEAWQGSSFCNIPAGGASLDYSCFVPSSGWPSLGTGSFLETVPSSSDSSKKNGGRKGVQWELTDAGGGFAFIGLGEGQYLLKANPPGTPVSGLSSEKKSVFAESGDTGVVVVLERNGGVKGRLSFAGGEHPSMFTVGQDRGKVHTYPFASGDGFFEVKGLPPGEYDFTFRGAGFEAKSVLHVKVLADLVVDIGTILVRPGMSIAGRVVDSEGQGVEGALVTGGHILMGSGMKVDMGSMGFGLATQSVTTDGSGRFLLTGVGRGDLTLVASHEAVGRSAPMSLVNAIVPLGDLLLVLKGYGSAEGVVTRDGRPVVGQMVNAQSRSAPLAMAVVRTQSDGRFRFDRLSPGEYSIGPVSGLSNFTLHTKAVTVVAGEVANIDFPLKEGANSLKVTVFTENEVVSSAAVVVIPEVVEDMKGNEMLAAIGTGDTTTWSIAITGKGRSALITKLIPGNYSACALAIPDKSSGLMAALAYLARYGSFIAARCAQVELGEGQRNYKVDIVVEEPLENPIPDEDGEKGT